MLIIAKIIYYWESIFRVSSWTLQKCICYLGKLLRVDQLYILQNAPSEGFYEIESIKAYPAKEAEDRE